MLAACWRTVCLQHIQPSIVPAQIASSHAGIVQQARCTYWQARGFSWLLGGTRCDSSSSSTASVPPSSPTMPTSTCAGARGPIQMMVLCCRLPKQRCQSSRGECQCAVSCCRMVSAQVQVQLRQYACCTSQLHGLNGPSMLAAQGCAAAAHLQRVRARQSRAASTAQHTRQNSTLALVDASLSHQTHQVRLLPRLAAPLLLPTAADCCKISCCQHQPAVASVSADC